MDTKRVKEDRYFRELRDVYKIRNREIRFDCAVVTDNDALDFLVRHREDLAPRVPIVFCGINDFSEEMLAGETEITGVIEESDFRGSIALALSLFPNTKRLVFVTDHTTTGIAYQREISGIQPEYWHSLHFIYLRLGILSMEEMLDLLSLYRKDTVVFVLQTNIDRNKEVFSVQEAMHRITAATDAPIMTVIEPYLGIGALGGKIVSGYRHGRIAAETAKRILEGEKAEGIPVVRESPTDYIFDHKEILRRGIPLSRLPKGSVVLNKPESYWARYQEGIPYFLLFLALETAIILLLLHNRKRRKAVEALLKSSLAEKDVLIKEIHHRVKNNLSVINSLINFQRRQAEDPRIDAALAETQSRIRSIALIHQRLHGISDETRLNVRRYCEDLIAEITDTFRVDRENIAFHIDMPEAEFETGFLKNLALIVNEAVTNALKHAFPTRRGRIRIRLTKKDPALWELGITDDGKGIDRLPREASSATGLHLIRSLVESIRGEWELKSENPGTSVIVRFKAVP